jgi:hypothetical protein
VALTAECLLARLLTVECLLAPVLTAACLRARVPMAECRLWLGLVSAVRLQALERVKPEAARLEVLRPKPAVSPVVFPAERPALEAEQVEALRPEPRSEA